MPPIVYGPVSRVPELISDVESWVIAAPEYKTGAWVIVRISTNNQYGIGECFVPDRAGGGAWAAKILVDTSFKKSLIGQSAALVAERWEAMYGIACSMYDRRGIAIHAISGLDIALHDLFGRMLGVPVYVLLGGLKQDRVPLYASCVHVDLDQIPQVIDDCRHYAGAGFRGIKFWGWAGFGDDEARDCAILQKMRAAVGKADLMLDLARPRDLTEALRLSRMIERSGADIAWWEEPFSSTDQPDELRELAKMTSIPIAAGESEKTVYAFRQLFRDNHIAFAQPDLSLCGGLTEGRRIAELVAAFGKRIYPHNWGTAINFAASLHLLSSLPTPQLCEYPITGRVVGGDRRQSSPAFVDLCSHDIRIEDGFAYLPDRPGLGIDLNMAAVKQLSIPAPI